MLMSLQLLLWGGRVAGVHVLLTLPTLHEHYINLSFWNLKYISFSSQDR